MIVGAVWHLSAREAHRVHPDFHDGIWVLLSQDGQVWAGYTATAAGQAGLVFQPGDTMPKQGAMWVSDYPGADSWESVRKRMLTNLLGKPKWGTNPLIKQEAKKDNICTCDWAIVLSKGCPSTRGLPCPNAKMDY